MFYVYGEDLAPGLVGPFETRESAEEHVEFWRRRGDAAACAHNNARIVTTQDIQKEKGNLLWAYNNNRCTSDKDRELPVR